MRIVSFAIFLLLAACTSLQETAVRTPSSWGDINSPCQDTRDCSQNLSCRKGWCQLPTSQLEAYERCGTNFECRSKRCEAGTCTPNQVASANNGETAFRGTPTNCRSRSVAPSGLCKGSSHFPAFSGQYCAVSTDCISGRCEQNTCRAGQDSLSCARLQQSCSLDSECCSGLCQNGKCSGKKVPACQSGSCGQAVGKICAADGKNVKFETECCSQAMAFGRCVKSPRHQYRFCEETTDCPSGLTCDPRRKICN